MTDTIPAFHAVSPLAAQEHVHPSKRSGDLPVERRADATDTDMEQLTLDELLYRVLAAPLGQERRFDV